MDVFEALETRRSVKKYDPTHRMGEDDVRKLLSATLFSPTSFNIQHWRFVVVNDGEERQRLRAAAWDQAQITDASLLVILCADVKAWEKNPHKYWQNAAPAVQNIIVPMIGSFYAGREQMQRDEAMRSCGIAAQSLMLAAKAMGYDSCPMIGFDPEAVAKEINLPHDHVVGLMIAVGKALSPANPRSGQLPYDEVVFSNRFDANNSLS